MDSSDARDQTQAVAAVTVSFFSAVTTTVAVLFQVTREGSNPMVFWDGRQPQAPHWRLVVGVADQEQLAFLVRIQLCLAKRGFSGPTQTQAPSAELTEGTAPSSPCPMPIGVAEQ